MRQPANPKPDEKQTEGIIERIDAMRLNSVDTTDFSSIGFALDSAPIDSDADQSLIFSYTGGTFVFSGLNPGAAALGSGVTVGGDANYASLVGNNSFNFGLPVGTAGFTLALVMRIPTTSTGNGAVCTNTGTSHAYGFFDIGGNLTFADYSTISNSTPFLKGLWQFFVFDVDSAGTIKIYRGYAGALTLIQTETTSGYTSTAASIITGLASSGYEVDLALASLYNNAKRPSLSALQLQYKRSRLWYTGRLANSL